MINDLFINMLILISATFIIGNVLREASLNLIRKQYPMMGKFLFGILGGLFGILLIVYAIKVDDTNTLVDLRYITILSVNAAAGMIPAVITGVIIGAFRLIYYGLNESSIYAIINIVVVLSFMGLFGKYIKNRWKSWFWQLFCSMLSLCITYFYLLGSVTNVHVIVLQFATAFALAGTLEFMLIEYIRSSNELYYKYKNESTQDFLTGLYNTRKFDILFNECLNNAMEKKEKLSCMMLDIDHFKKVNDTYGHAAGDVVLKELAEVLKKVCRSFDIISRIGGEEFCVLLMDCTEKHATEIGVRIIEAVEEHKFKIDDGKYINVTISAGVSTFPDTVADPEQIIKRADEALYLAKHSGRNRVCSQAACTIE